MTELLVNQMVQHGVVNGEDAEIYQYGLRSLWMLLINMAVVFTIGLLAGELPYTVIFLSGFAWIRAYSGGFHSKSKVRCCIFSTLIYCLCLIAKEIMIQQEPLFLLVCIAIPSLIIIVIKYRARKVEAFNFKMTIVVMEIEWLIYVFAMAAGIRMAAIAIQLGILILSVLLVIKELVNREVRS